MKRCIIFAGGKLGSLDFINIIAIKEQGDMVICADSGLKAAEKLGIIPDLIVGDFDSYTDELPTGIEILRSVPEKDDTDTMLAVKTAISRGYNEIQLYGGLGARFDHSYANIQTLVYALENGCEMTICDAENELTVRKAGEYRFEKREGWYFSLFALTETAVIGDYYGVKYPLKDYHMTIGFPIGVSNEITDEEAYLRIDSGIVLIVRAKGNL